MYTPLPFRYFLVILTCLFAFQAYAQSVCPPNIGFEDGTFSGWKAYTGKVSGGGLPMTEGPPDYDRHVIFQNSSPQLMDIMGNFPVNAPNGSRYSVRLGNQLLGGDTEMLTYTFTVPANASEFSLAYNYAVVFEDGGHPPMQQPMFSAKVFNITDGKYIACGSFDFTASSNLPGFQLSPFRFNRDPVYYKSWSTVTLTLSNMAGKQLRLEFITQDCVPSGHRGYAYVDVMEGCASPILGNVYCLNNSSVTLRGPVGYQEYYWYNASDMNTVLGVSERLTLSPPPANGTVYALKVVPYAGYGCLDTLYTTVQGVGEFLSLNVTPDTTVCSDPGLNLKGPDITRGSSPNLTFSYFTDQATTLYVPNPEKVIQSGTYYIKAENQWGCEEVRPINVTVRQSPQITVRTPVPVCLPQTVDLTDPALIASVSPGVTISYWRDAAGTQPLANPQSVSASGSYFIRATNDIGCFTMAPISVVVEPAVIASAGTQLGCAPFNLTDPAFVSSNVAAPILTYWMDDAATVPIADPTRMMQAGTYYIRVANYIGCSAVIPIRLDLLPYPTVDAADPVPVVFPATIDIASAYTAKVNHSYTYWRDSLATQPLDNPGRISISGKYFVKITNQAGCSSVQGVRISILPSPLPDLVAPSAFSPNNDGVNDIFRVELVGAVQIKDFRVFNRWGEQLYITTTTLTGDWDGKLQGSDLPTGTYYWVYTGIDYYRNQPFTRSGSVTIIR